MNVLKKIFFLIVVSLVIPGSVFAKYVAVLETGLDQKDLLSFSERQYLTNVLREQAVRILPAEQNFTIMTRENINMMLPPGKSIEDCEGSCLAETGKNIAADYVAQARVGKFGESFTISAELYETASNKLVASFNGRSKDVDGLVSEITAKSPEFFKKVRGENSWSGSGFSDFSVSGNQSFIVKVSSNPAKAMLSIDGRPSKCSATPCKLQVEAGEHRFLLVRDQYKDFDSVVTVNANDQEISFSLVPNFGTLTVNPELTGNAGKASDLKVLVDGKSFPVAKPKNLTVGVHSVKITHPCYDPLDFKVGLEQGADEKFESPLTRSKGGLKLNAEMNGEPDIVPVYVDGANVGNTPFLGEVPLCSKIEVGYEGHMETVNVNLKYHETVEFTHAQTPIKDLGKIAPIDSGKSVPANVDTTGKKIHWIPVGISAAVMIGGATYAVIKNKAAKDKYEEGASSAAEYKSKKDDIHKDQTGRMIGIGVAIVGAIGLGLSFVF